MCAMFFSLAISLINITAAVASITSSILACAIALAIALRECENLYLAVFVLRANKGASAGDEIEVLLKWAAGMAVVAALPPLLRIVPVITKASVKLFVCIEFWFLVIVALVFTFAVFVCGKTKLWLILALVLMVLIASIARFIRVKKSEFDSSTEAKSETIIYVLTLLKIVTSILCTILIIKVIIDVSKSEMPTPWTISLTFVYISLALLLIVAKLVAIRVKLIGPKWYWMMISIMQSVLNCILILVTACIIFGYSINEKRAFAGPGGWFAAVFIAGAVAVTGIILCVCKEKYQCPVKFCHFQVTVAVAAALMIVVAIYTGVITWSALKSASKQSPQESNVSCVTNLSSTDLAVAMRSRSQALLSYGLKIPIGHKSTFVDVSEMLLTRVKAKTSASLLVETEMPRQARLKVTAEVSNLFAAFFARQLPVPLMDRHFQPTLTASPVTAIVNAEMMSNGSPKVEIRVLSSYLVINDLGFLRKLVVNIADFIDSLEQKVQENVESTFQQRITRGLQDVWPSPDVKVRIDRVRISWNSK